METRLLVAAIAVFASPLAFAAPAAAAEPTKDECIDANEAAQTLGQGGKLVAAKRKLLVCVATSCPGPIKQDCALRLADVEAKMPTLVLEAQDNAGHALATVRVTMDGQALFDKLGGEAFALDPGEHRFGFDAEGFSTAERTIVVREAEKNRRERVVLAASTTAAASAEVAPATRASERQPSDGRTQRIIGLALGGAGVAGGIVGAVFGLVSKSTYNHAFTAECGGVASHCTQAGYQDGQTAHSQATIATVGFIGGLALLGGGALLYFTAPKGTEVSFGPEVGRTEAGFGFHGRW